MQRLLKLSTLLLIHTFFLTWLPAQEAVVRTDSMALALVQNNADSLLNSEWFVEVTGYQKRDSTIFSSVVFLNKPNRIRLYADKQLAYAPFRESTIDSLLSGIGRGLWEPFSNYKIELYSGRVNIRTLVPNYYRTSALTMDKKRSTGKLKRKSPPLVSNLSRPYLRKSALYNTNIALWHSHGWYYEAKLDRWEWQRARIFQTVEDIYPLSYTMPFLVPMLENAGANVFVPRERDWQVNEVVVDNNGSTGRSLYVAPENITESYAGGGFALGHPPYVDHADYGNHGI